MIARCRFILAALIIAAAMPLAQLRAQPKPVAVLSVSSIDSVLGSIQYLTDSAGAADFGQIAAMMAMPYTEGLDRANPIGLVLSSDGQQFVPLGFVPVKDLSKTLSLLEGNFGPPRDAGNGIQEILAPQPIFIKQQGEWAYLGQTVESLANLPEDPATMLRQLPQNYDVAIRAYVQNVPQAYVDMAVTTLQEGIKQGLQQLPEEERRSQQEMVQAQMKQLETFIRESDEITLGWKTEPGEKRTYLDMSFTAVAGGDLAKQMSAMADAKSDFTSLIMPDAAMTMNMASEIPAEQIQTSVEAIEKLKQTAMREIEKDDDLESPEARQAAKELLGAALDIFAATIKTGKIDGAASVVLKPGSLHVLGGFHVAEGQEVENVLRRLAEMAENEPNFPGIQFNADSQSGVAFHTMSVPIPEGEDAAKVLGDTLTIAVGVGEESTYFGVGADCVSQLKSAISSRTKQQAVSPFHLTFSLKRVMEFVASVEENPVVGSVRDALQSSGDKDHLKISSIPIANGCTYRIELEEGVLRGIGAAIKMANAGGF